MADLDRLDRAEMQLHRVRAVAACVLGHLADGRAAEAAGLLESRTSAELVAWGLLETPAANVDALRRMAGPGSRDSAATWASLDAAAAAGIPETVEPRPPISASDPDRGCRLEAVLAGVGRVERFIRGERLRTSAVGADVQHAVAAIAEAGGRATSAELAEALAVSVRAIRETIAAGRDAGIIASDSRGHRLVGA